MVELLAMIGAALIGIPVLLAIMTIIILPLVALRGYVVSKLWAWFIVPIFGLPTLSVAQAVGVSLVVTYFTYHQTPDLKSKDKKEKIEAAVVSLSQPLLTLLMGYIVHRYFM